MLCVGLVGTVVVVVMTRSLEAGLSGEKVDGEKKGVGGCW